MDMFVLNSNEDKVINREEKIFMDSLIASYDSIFTVRTSSKAHRLKIKLMIDSIFYNGKHYFIGKYFEIEHNQKIRLFNTLGFIDVVYTCSENDNGVFYIQLQPNNSDYQLFVSNIVFEDSFYNPDNESVIPSIENEKFIDRHSNILKIDGTVASQIEIFSSNNMTLKLLFFLDAIELDDKIYKVGKYYEVEQLQEIQIVNELGVTIINYTCMKSDENMYNWNLITNNGAILYVSNVLFMDTLYNYNASWLNPDNPDNIIESIEISRNIYAEVTQLQIDLAQEIINRTNADEEIKEALSNETLARLDGDISLREDLEDEIDRATSREDSFQLDIADLRNDVNTILEDGVAGKSAYEIAVDNGFVGTEIEWLISLNGTSPVIRTASNSSEAMDLSIQYPNDIIKVVN